MKDHHWEVMKCGASAVLRVSSGTFDCCIFRVVVQKRLART